MGVRGQKQPIPKNLQHLRDLFKTLEKGKSTWEATFDAIRDAVMIIGRDRIVERANVAAAERAGVDVAHMIGRHCYEVFAGRPDVCPRCPLEDTIDFHHPRSVEIEKLQRENDFRVNSYPLPLEEGHARAVHQYQDVSEERKMQKRLMQTEKMAALGMLAGGVAHEINNPLGGILAFTQLLKSELPADSSAQGDLREIEEAVRRCKTIVEDLLSFARPSSGIPQTPQEVSKLLEKILPLIRLNLRTNAIAIETQYDPHLPPILGEANRLQQVFLNLIQNAAESMKEGGTVKIRTHSDTSRREVFVEIQDVGIGIPESELWRIFDPFFTTKGVRGTGLGLAICDSIVRDHKGRIEVKSVVGKGSTFSVVLPAAS